MDKVYIGDSVYVAHDDYHVILTTENGRLSDPSNIIYLKPSVWRNLVDYVERLKEQMV